MWKDVDASGYGVADQALLLGFHQLRLLAAGIDHSVYGSGLLFNIRHNGVLLREGREGKKNIPNY